VSEGLGQTVTAGAAKSKQSNTNRDKGIGVTVYVGQQRGTRAARFLSRAIRDNGRCGVVDRALHRGRSRCGARRPDLIARDIRDLDLYHPWDLPVERAIESPR
jgi:PmbA protein